MPQILVRNLDKAVVARLKRQARQAGRSLQAEVRRALEQAAAAPGDMAAARALVEQLRRRLRGRRFPDSAQLIRRGRER